MKSIGLPCPRPETPATRGVRWPAARDRKRRSKIDLRTIRAEHEHALRRERSLSRWRLEEIQFLLGDKIELLRIPCFVLEKQMSPLPLSLQHRYGTVMSLKGTNFANILQLVELRRNCLLTIRREKL